MLSIIWSILKIIGIIILIILGVLFVVLFAVLFVPFRYEAHINGQYGKDGEENGPAYDFYVRARVSWLLRFICVRARADGSGFGAKIKILGIPFIKIGQEKRNSRKTVPSPLNKQLEEPFSEPKKIESPVEAESQAGAKEAVFLEQPAEIKQPEMIEQSEEIETPEKEPLSAKIGKKLKNIWSKICAQVKRVFQKIKSIFQSICGKIQKIREMSGLIWEFLTDEDNREVFRFAVFQLKKLAKQILPRKLSGKVDFSLEDPASTGKVLMILGIVYPMLQGKVQVMPLFEDRTYFAGELYLKGRIRVFSLLIIVLKTWFDKRTKAFMGRIRKLKENLG